MSEISKELADFLVDLGQNPNKLRYLRDDPEQFLNNAGLSDEAKEIIKSGDPIRLREAISEEKLAGDVVVVVVVVIAV